MREKSFVLDRLDGLTISADQRDAHANALGAAGRQLAGLQHLYATVRAEEVARRQGDRIEMRWPAEPVGAVPVDMLFAWYSVTACSMVSLLGRIAGECGHPNCGEEGQAYCSRVCGPVLVYRNKVAAHFAWTAPRKGKDNEVDREMSVMPPITRYDDRLRAGVMAIQRTRGGVAESPSHDYRWTLTEFHEQAITARYGKREAAAPEVP